MAFTKLHATILDSSVWQEPAHVRLVWITMLAMADQSGIVQASIGGLAHRARVTREECVEALNRFLGPDPDSRDRTTGERIEAVPGGWLVLNHANYRDKQTHQQALTAARVARHRAKRAGVTRPQVTAVHATSRSEADAEVEADADADAESIPPHSGAPAAGAAQDQSEHVGATTTPPPKRSRNSGAPMARHEAVEHDPAFLAFWNAYDHKVDKVMAAKSWGKIAPSADLAAEITTAAAAYAAAKPDKQYRKHPSTWLNNRCWENDVSVSNLTVIGTPKGGGYDSRGRWRGVDPMAKPSDYTPKNYDDPFGDLNP